MYMDAIKSVLVVRRITQNDAVLIEAGMLKLKKLDNGKVYEENTDRW